MYPNQTGPTTGRQESIVVSIYCNPKPTSCPRILAGLLGPVPGARSGCPLAFRPWSQAYTRVEMFHFDSALPLGSRDRSTTGSLSVLRLPNLPPPGRPAQPPLALSSFSLLSSPFSLRFCTTSQLYTLAVATSIVWQRVSTDSPHPWGWPCGTHRDLLPQEFRVLLAVHEALLGLAQPLHQERLGLIHRVRQHDVRAEPDVHLVGGRHLGLGKQRVVELESRLDRVRLVLVLLSASST